MINSPKELLVQMCISQTRMRLEPIPMRARMMNKPDYNYTKALHY